MKLTCTRSNLFSFGWTRFMGTGYFAVEKTLV